MSNPKPYGGSVADRGEEIYEASLRDIIEIEANIGKFVSIDVDSGECDVDADPVAAGVRLRGRRPAARMYGKRIGYDAAFAIGGALSRTRR